MGKWSGTASAALIRGADGDDWSQWRGGRLRSLERKPKMEGRALGERGPVSCLGERRARCALAVGKRAGPSVAFGVALQLLPPLDAIKDGSRTAATVKARRGPLTSVIQA